MYSLSFKTSKDEAQSSQRVSICLSVIFVLLSGIGISSYWLLNTNTNQSIAITVHSLLLICTFIFILFIAFKNTRKQKLQDIQREKAQSILYDITTTINSCHDLKELLETFCNEMSQSLNARNVSIWLITEHNWLEYISSTGIDPKVTDQPKRIKLTNELINTLRDNRIIHSNEHVVRLAEILQCDVSEETQSYYIPLHSQEHILGIVRIKIAPIPFDNVDNFKEVLIRLGNQLSIAIEKARIDQETRRMIIMEERSLIANELHDSLAQTLASLRFQVRVLDETLQPMSEFQSIRGIEQVENSLDEAYTDLRELIAHCRTPIKSQGLIAAVEKLLSRFRKESGIHVLLQTDWQNSDLPPNMEMHIFRIVQEAMNNIRKHSGAHNVRIMFRCDDDGNHSVLVENDGLGFETPNSSDHPGKHLGLTIMRERAIHLGGELRIESEPDEGTRIELVFTYNNESQHDPLQRLSGIDK
ncbi:MAG: histidine kinase [Gammaproteobacteria bacterium]|nr:histidine kinase [Gammaproteobacteria bacterium]MCW8911150.1 histidine kinase [Gammaproteobacteria bacterium]MCW9005734.1 histidine kinase [Gammaproteobacteria bacterium]MCW9055898.1 histidine kinase [Gammaproteobacteria bacterium]